MVHLVTCLAFTILWYIGMRNQPPPVLCTSNGEPQLCTFLKTEPILNNSSLVSLNLLLQEVSRWLVTPEVDKPKFRIMCFLFMFVPASWNTKYLFPYFDDQPLYLVSMPTPYINSMTSCCALLHEHSGFPVSPLHLICVQKYYRNNVSAGANTLPSNTLLLLLGECRTLWGKCERAVTNC